MSGDIQHWHTGSMLKMCTNPVVLSITFSFLSIDFVKITAELARDTYNWSCRKDSYLYIGFVIHANSFTCELYLKLNALHSLQACQIPCYLSILLSESALLAYFYLPSVCVLFQIKCVKGDLFSCPQTDSLAHCISEDCRMGAGIAVLFKKKFGGVQELLDQREWYTWGGHAGAEGKTLISSSKGIPSYLGCRGD